MAPTHMTLVSAKASIDVPVLDTPVGFDITEAPGLTLTVPDASRLLSDYTPGLLGDEKTDLLARVYGHPWRVTETQHARDQVTFTLEHRGAWGMRSLVGPLAVPDDIKRPQFASLLWSASRAGNKSDALYTPLVNPEAAGFRPPVIKAETRKGDRTARAQRDTQLAAGFKPGASFKIKGDPADDEQKRVLASVLSVCDDEKAPRLAKLAAVCTVIVESEAKNLAGGDADSVGPFQARLKYTPQDVATSVEKSTRKFLQTGFTGAHNSAGASKLARQHPDWSAGRIAQTCQGSRFPDRYQQHVGEARAILDAWSGADSADASAAAETGGAFTLAAGEDAWSKFKQVATDSRRRGYATLERIVFATDNQHENSRPLMVVERRAPGVKAIGTWKTDVNRQVDVMPFELNCPDEIAWALAGHTVEVRGEGDANGIWLVTKFNRATRRDRHVSFEAERLRRFLPESKIQQATSKAAAGAASTTTKSTSTDQRPTKVKRIVDLVDRDNKAYFWGGYARSTGFDCSGLCSYVGNELGIVSGRLTTGPFSTWGEAGEGEVLTFWVSEIPGNPRGSHMYGTVKVGGQLRKFEAGGGTDGGPTGWRPASSPVRRAGFKPRHAKGW